MAQKVTSTDIKLALKEFHNGKPSYFITECKTCSTYFPDPQGLLKFDGLAITKSYTKPNIIGYEIKVSRNDFLQDNKWHLYLQYCNEFYFVVPKGLVKKEELPDHVGLIYFNPDTKGLRTVKKALYRQIEEPVGVYKYIIFSRLEEDRIPFYNDRAEYCKDYLEDKVVKSAIGQRLGTKLAKDLEDAEKRLKSLQSAEKELYMDVIPTFSNCGVEGYLKVRKCTEHKEDVKWVEQRGVEQKEKTKKPKLLHTILQKLS